MIKPVAILVDIDGTIAHRQERGLYDWHRVGEDIPDTTVINAVRALHFHGYYDIVFISGRSEVCELETREWLDAHVPFPYAGPFMRPGDRPYEPDFRIKRDLYVHHIQPKWDVAIVFDDRDTVVGMWRNKFGLKVFQVADGDF